MLLVTLIAALTLGDWNARLEEVFEVEMYRSGLKSHQMYDVSPEAPGYAGQAALRRSWCRMETKTSDVVTSIEKIIIMEEYEGEPLTPTDIKHLKVIQLDWKTKEAEAHQRCLGLY